MGHIIWRKRAFLKSPKVTMSTIGYGNEQVPKTILGKIVTVKCAIFGIICMGEFDKAINDKLRCKFKLRFQRYRYHLSQRHGKDFI